jgi:hypothetical protein
VRQQLLKLTTIPLLQVLKTLSLVRPKNAVAAVVNPVRVAMGLLIRAARPESALKWPESSPWPTQRDPV